LSVDCRRCYFERVAIGEPTSSGDIACLLADLYHAATNELPDVGRIDASPFDNATLDMANHMGRVKIREGAASLLEGGSAGFDNHRC